MSIAMLHGVSGNSTPNLGTKSINTNGTYNASSDNLDGYSQVSVDVPPTLFRQLVNGDIRTVTAQDLAGVTQIRHYSFYQVRNLSIQLPDSIETIGSWAFRGCGESFYKMTVKLPNITSLSGFAFSGIDSGCIFILGSSLTSIDGNCFMNTRCKRIILRATTPPTVGTQVFTTSYGYPIFVPIANIDTYKAATNWVTYASNIFPLVSTVSDLSNVDTTTYTKACVIGTDESYKAYTYDGTSWNEVT